MRIRQARVRRRVLGFCRDPLQPYGALLLAQSARYSPASLAFVTGRLRGSPHDIRHVNPTTIFTTGRVPVLLDFRCRHTKRTLTEGRGQHVPDRQDGMGAGGTPPTVPRAPGAAHNPAVPRGSDARLAAGRLPALPDFGRGGVPRG